MVLECWAQRGRITLPKSITTNADSLTTTTEPREPQCRVELASSMDLATCGGSAEIPRAHEFVVCSCTFLRGCGGLDLGRPPGTSSPGNAYCDDIPGLKYPDPGCLRSAYRLPSHGSIQDTRLWGGGIFKSLNQFFTRMYHHSSVESLG